AVPPADRADGPRPPPWLSQKAAGVVAGGARRQESVAEGIRAVSVLDGLAEDEAAARIVLVHDGARPLVTPALVGAVIEAIETHGAAVPMLAIPDTVRRVAPDGQVLETIDRTGL